MQTHEIKAAQKYRSAWSCRAISVEDGARMYALSAEGPTLVLLLHCFVPYYKVSLRRRQRAELLIFSRAVNRIGDMC